jgi:asparagine synthase (glutamine-hydrolysing)
LIGLHFKEVGFGMRRLAIIDVNGGNQPLYNEDRSIAIVGNGEIYNYLEIKKELSILGHKFRTGSDIEIAIHAYEQYGEKAFEKFRGMFALALHDQNKKLVYLIRDRMGEKPIYYSKIDNKLVFASELKTFTDIQNFDKTLNFEAINNFFHFYFIPEPQTPFLSLNKVPSGSFLKINLETHSELLVKYWNPEAIRPTVDKNPIKMLRKIFDDTSKLILRSDVPVGVSLSGGIDSSSILAYCAPKYKGNLKAFSVGYEGNNESDERKMAKELANQYGIEFFEKEIKISEVVNHFPRLVWDCDEPIADIAAHAIYEVSKIARSNNVKVLLNGAGGDEIFWGYPSTIDSANRNINRSFFEKILKGNRYFYNNPDPDSTGTIIETLYSKGFKNHLNIKGYRKLFKRVDKKNQLAVAKYTMDMVRNLWLKNDVVTLGDRMSMASSVELRAPYLDYKLIEYALRSKKIVNGYKKPRKYYQKEMFKGVLSNDILDRPKRGFTPPVTDWVIGIIKKYSKLLNDGFLVKENIIDKTKINIATNVSKIVPNYTLYQMLVIEIWGRIFVYNEKIPSLTKKIK